MQSIKKKGKGFNNGSSLTMGAIPSTKQSGKCYTVFITLKQYKKTTYATNGEIKRKLQSGELLAITCKNRILVSETIK